VVGCGWGGVGGYRFDCGWAKTFVLSGFADHNVYKGNTEF